MYSQTEASVFDVFVHSISRIMCVDDALVRMCLSL